MAFSGLGSAMLISLLNRNIEVSANIAKSGVSKMEILETNKLTKIYPPARLPAKGMKDILRKLMGKERGEPVVALDEVSMKVRAGELFGLLGPNGAGKTTLCKILNAVTLPTSGSAHVAGLDVIKEHRRIASKVFGMFGGEIEMHGLFMWRIDLEKNLRFLCRLWRVPSQEIPLRIDGALRALDLMDKKHEWYQRLSGGQRQKAWLACVLCIRPELCILDEPSIRLDVRTRLRLYRLLREDICRGYGGTVFITTHNLPEAEALCDRLAIMNRGRIVAVDRPGALKKYVRKERIIEVVISQDRPRLYRSLAAVRGVLNCEAEKVLPEGVTMGLTVDAESFSYREIMGAILASKVDILSIKERTSSLEDVFLKLTAEETCHL